MASLAMIDLSLQKIKKDCDVTKARVVAIAFTNNGHIVAIETNRRIIGWDEEKIFSIHAERFLIKKLVKTNAHKRFKNINMLVVRLADYGMVMAKPCRACMEAIKNYGYFREVTYTTPKGIKRLNHEHN